MCKKVGRIDKIMIPIIIISKYFSLPGTRLPRKNPARGRPIAQRVPPMTL